MATNEPTPISSLPSGQAGIHAPPPFAWIIAATLFGIVALSFIEVVSTVNRYVNNHTDLLVSSSIWLGVTFIGSQLFFYKSARSIKPSIAAIDYAIILATASVIGVTITTARDIYVDLSKENVANFQLVAERFPRELEDYLRTFCSDPSHKDGSTGAGTDQVQETCAVAQALKTTFMSAGTLTPALVVDRLPDLESNPELMLRESYGPFKSLYQKYLAIADETQWDSMAGRFVGILNEALFLMRDAARNHADQRHAAELPSFAFANTSGGRMLGLWIGINTVLLKLGLTLVKKYGE